MILKNDNRNFIKTLSDNCLKANRIRNRIALLAIILTAVLFTTVVTVLQGTSASMEEQSLRMSGTRFMTSIKYVSPEKAEKILNDDAFVKVGAEQLVSFAENEELKRISAVITCMDETYAKENYSKPEQGYMPKEADEIACDSAVLNMLGLPQEPGSRFTLQYTVNEEPREKEMTVCGIWEGDALEQFANLLVSEAFLEENIDESLLTDGSMAAGCYVIRGSFRSKKDIAGQLDKVVERAGFNPKAESDEEGYVVHHVSPVYERKSQVNVGTAAGAVIAALLVLLAGYLIIYNIFRISVIKDIRLYGQLKTIGTSPKQIQYMVRRQGNTLAWRGIPVGLVLGWLLANILMPLIMKSSNYKEQIFIWPNVYVWAASAVFAFFTVWISCRRPGKIAGSISPVEALRYQEQDNGKKKQKKGRASGHRILQMAYSNLGRSRGKTVLVVLSLSLSIVLINSVLNGVGCFDRETYIKREAVADFNVMDVMANKPTDHTSVKYVSEEFAETLKDLPGVKDFGKSYCYQIPETEDELYMENPAVVKSWNGKAVSPENVDEFDPARMVIGFDENALSRGTLIEGKVDYEKLSTGQYVVAVGSLDDYNEYSLGMQDFHPGDTVEAEIKGEVKTYQVMAVMGMPHKLLADYSLGGYEALGFSENVFQEMLPEVEGPIHCVFDAEEGSFDQIKTYLKSQENVENITITTREEAEKDFEELMLTFSGAGMVFALIFAIIGILNLMNVILTGAIARQSEFATMRSVGMSRKQLRRLFLYEGIFYALLAGAAGVIFGGVLSVTMVKGIIKGFWFAKYHFDICPAIVSACICLGISAVIAYVIDQMWNKGSIVEKMRRSE